MQDRPVLSNEAPSANKPRTSRPRRRHRWRWIAAGALTLIVVAVAGTGLAVTLTPEPAPLALPKGAAAPAGPLDGTWQVTGGSVAGFRVRETVIGFSNDLTGRTSDVAGTLALTGTQVTRAVFRVNLDAIAVNGKTRQPQLVRSLAMATDPDATVTLTQPLPLSPAFSTGAVVSLTTPATLTLHGITRPVTVTLSAQRNGSAIEAAGSLPVSFQDFGIAGPAGYGAFGSLASNGTAEFLLVFRLS